MLHIDVRLDTAVYDRFQQAAGTMGGEPGRVVSAIVSDMPVFGSEAPFIAKEPGSWFDLDGLASADFWRHQDRLREYIEAELLHSAETIAPYLPQIPDSRVVPVVVHPVPGFTKCYGNEASGQLFGLYHGADPREMLLFLSHTYYHELSETLNTETTRQAAARPTTAARFRHWLLSLIRNEGIANYAVLRQLRELRAEGVEFRYFKYAGLIDDAGATARAMFACREVLRMLDDHTVRNVARRVSVVLKNPRLPVINLIGIHMAEAIAAQYGERALLDVDKREPQEFFLHYADSADPLREQLFGAPDGAGRAVFGIESDWWSR